MPAAGFSSHHSLSCPVCKVGKTVIMADYRGRWLGCISCSLNTVTSLSNTTAEHAECKHMGTLWFFGCWGSIPLHLPISWLPVPFALCHVRGTDTDYPPQGAVGNNSLTKLIGWQFVPQALSPRAGVTQELVAHGPCPHVQPERRHH